MMPLYCPALCHLSMHLMRNFYTTQTMLLCCPALCHGPRRGAVVCQIPPRALVPRAAILLLETSGARVCQKGFGVLGHHGESQTHGRGCRCHFWWLQGQHLGVQRREPSSVPGCQHEFDIG